VTEQVERTVGNDVGPTETACTGLHAPLARCLVSLASETRRVFTTKTTRGLCRSDTRPQFSVTYTFLNVRTCAISVYQAFPLSRGRPGNEASSNTEG
jgi:hypothetical protein